MFASKMLAFLSLKINLFDLNNYQKIMFKTTFQRNKLLLSLTFLLILSGSIFAQDRTWTTFTPKTEAWSILAPGTMRADQEALKVPSNQGSYSYTDFNGFFAVIYKNYSKWNFLTGKGSQFTKQRDVVLKASKGKLLKDVEFTNGSITGREVYIRMPDTRVIGRESNIKPRHRVERFRMFFQGNRMYMLLVVLPEEEIDTPAINNFLNSFSFK